MRYISSYGSMTALFTLLASYRIVSYRIVPRRVNKQRNERGSYARLDGAHLPSVVSAFEHGLGQSAGEGGSQEVGAGGGFSGKD